MHFKKLFFILILFFLPNYLFAQYTLEKSIAFNISGAFFNDFSFFYEYTNKKSKRIGISAGYMIANNWWHGKPGTTSGFEVNDDKFPIGAYNGPELRLSFIRLTKSLNDKISFNGVQFL